MASKRGPVHAGAGAVVYTAASTRLYNSHGKRGSGAPSGDGRWGNGRGGSSGGGGEGGRWGGGRDWVADIRGCKYGPQLKNVLDELLHSRNLLDPSRGRAEKLRPIEVSATMAQAGRMEYRLKAQAGGGGGDGGGSNRSALPPNDPLVAAFCDAAVDACSKMTAQDVVVVVQALGTLGWTDNSLLSAILHRVAPAADATGSDHADGGNHTGYRSRGRGDGVTSFSPEQYAAFMWGCSHIYNTNNNGGGRHNQTKHAPDPFCSTASVDTTAAAPQTDRPATQLPLRHLHDVCTALAKQHIRPANEGRSSSSRRGGGVMNNKALSQLAWACATMSIDLKQHQVTALLTKIKSQAETMNSQDVSMCMYSLAKIIVHFDGVVNFKVTPTLGKLQQMKTERGRQVLADERDSGRAARVPQLLKAVSALEARLLTEQEHRSGGPNGTVTKYVAICTPVRLLAHRCVSPRRSASSIAARMLARTVVIIISARATARCQQLQCACGARRQCSLCCHCHSVVDCAQVCVMRLV